ncbi:hypothetical protein B0O99DRAFT_347787 [Bisporella sp. PMI_857]|nr:hypothetical protein B0O99DRAFT_347787 [Bisporella sp. PMI_857]
MSLIHLFIVFFAFGSHVVLAHRVSRRQDVTASNVTITALTKNESATTGSGAVSAAGPLSPFGTVGIGCGINWQEGQSLGGGLQAGSDIFGFGSGVTIGTGTMEVGLGVSVIPSNISSTVSVAASTNGTVVVTFTSTNGFRCDEVTVDGAKTVRCTSK